MHNTDREDTSARQAINDNEYQRTVKCTIDRDKSSHSCAIDATKYCDTWYVVCPFTTPPRHCQPSLKTVRPNMSSSHRPSVNFKVSKLATTSVHLAQIIRPHDKGRNATENRIARSTRLSTVPQFLKTLNDCIHDSWNDISDIRILQTPPISLYTMNRGDGLER